VHTPLQHALTISDVQAWLKITCLKCGRGMLPPDVLAAIVRLPRVSRLGEAKTRSNVEGKSCPGCGTVHPKIERMPDDHMTFRLVDPGARRDPTGPDRRFLPGEIRAVLERIEPDYITALTPDLRQHPRNLLVQSVAIPPVTIRPQVRIPSLPAADSYNVLTTLYARMLLTNHKVPTDLGADRPDPDTEAAILGLNDFLFAAMKGSGASSAASKKRGTTLSTVQPNSSLLDRQQRKEGRVRQHLLGARCWLLSRATISGNPDLAPNQVGIPLRFARAFEVQESVTPANLERLTAMFLRRDPGAYPRCRSVVRRATGRLHDISRLPPDVFLTVGDVVVRDAIDGDVALFNRQPSLERSAITALEIVVMRDPTLTTFQINVIITPLFNADFNNRLVTELRARC
jgi:DNA-directed RNA polymerase beta' subunit